MDIKLFLQKYIPSKKQLQRHGNLNYLGHSLGNRLHDTDLWKLTRKTSAQGVAIGCFWAMFPFPVQTILSALTAIWLRANLPLAVICVWISNPVTIPPLYYLAYKLGSVLLDQPIYPISFELSMSWFTHTFTTIWQPLMLGCLLLGICNAAIAYTVIQILWKIKLIKRWRKRNASNGIIS